VVWRVGDFAGLRVRMRTDEAIMQAATRKRPELSVPV
jgi:hypothetical protein